MKRVPYDSPAHIRRRASRAAERAQLAVGYLVRWLSRVGRRQCIAAAMETGLHNRTLAIAVGLAVLGDGAVVPSVLYSAITPIPVVICALLFTHGVRSVARTASV